jgi:hypothetical protein
MDCTVFHSEMAWGATLKLLSPKILLTGLAGAYLDLGGGLDTFFRLGPTVELGILANPWSPYKLRLRSLTSFDVFQSARPPAFETLEFSQSLSWLPHWEVRLTGLATSAFGASTYIPLIYQEGKLSLNYYF